ncbi:unnamed protein product [Orchesella dallaii]
MDVSTHDKALSLCRQEHDENTVDSVLDGLDQEELEQELDQLKKKVESMGHGPSQGSHIVTVMGISGTPSFTPGDGIVSQGIERIEGELVLTNIKAPQEPANPNQPVARALVDAAVASGSGSGGAKLPKPVSVAGAAALEETGNEKVEKKKNSWWVRVGRAFIKRKKQVLPKSKGKTGVETTSDEQEAGPSGKDKKKADEAKPKDKK